MLSCSMQPMITSTVAILCVEGGGSDMHVLNTNISQYTFCIYICICKTQIDVQSLIDVQSSNQRPILKSIAVSHFLKSMSLTYASNDVIPVRSGFWNNDDAEATRQDSRWGILDDKKKIKKYMTLYWWYWRLRKSAKQSKMQL
jgi:hypothetical protein